MKKWWLATLVIFLGISFKSVAQKKSQVLPNFQYITADGDTCRISSLKAEKVLLFFNDPTCEECSDIKHDLSQSQAIKELVAIGKLAIVSIYLFDEINEWIATPYPECMIKARDCNENIIGTDAISFSSVPYLYLIDNNRVIIAESSALAPILPQISR